MEGDAEEERRPLLADPARPKKTPSRKDSYSALWNAVRRNSSGGAERSRPAWPRVRCAAPAVKLAQPPSFPPTQIFTVVLFAGLGGLLFGYDSSDIAIALPVRRLTALARGVRCTLSPARLTPAQFIERSFKSVAQSNALKELVVSVATLGAAAGAFTGGLFSDAFGRRSAIILCDVLFLVAALKMGTAMTPQELVQGRAIIGVAIGLASMVGPVYIAETSPNSIRATLVVMYSIEIGVGTARPHLSCCPLPHSALPSRSLTCLTLDSHIPRSAGG